jgi:hypothetical protein
MMNTNFEGRDVMFQVTYGSKLYGTSTPTSDTDLKSIYLPALDDVLLGKRLVATKSRVDANGVKVPDDASMPDGGIENEYIPFQTFVRDFVNGQTYAIECAYAILKDGPSAPTAHDAWEFSIVEEMVSKFGNNEVYSMVGFAMKQTFDYVRRGERLNEATKVLTELRSIAAEYVNGFEPRLDSVSDDETVLDVLARRTGLPIGSSVNNNRTQRTLELNGRSYLESTRLDHIIEQVQKLVKQYGERTTRASETDVDYKSISHAVRVYQQAIEILDTGKLTFPRWNAAYLLEVKQGKRDLEEVKDLLVLLDNDVQAKMLTSTVRKKTPELVAEAEQWLLSKLQELYDLGLNA